ncbi:MAG: carbohydrate ABC transporter permease [Acholeplasmataceae bacterium]|jgi:multiple sugar transport system permease protein
MTRKNNIFKSIQQRSKSFYDKNLSTKDKRKKIANKSKNFGVSLIKYLLVYGLSFIIIYPLLQQISIALRAPEDLNNPLVLWIPMKFSLANLKVALKVLDYWKSLWTTAKVSLIVTTLQLIVTSFVGYALARLKFPGRNLVFIFVIFTIVVPPMTIELPLKISFMNFLGTGKNLLGSPKILYILAATGMGIKAGIFIYLFRQFFRAIPEELEDAAIVDGANPFQVFFRVMLPNATGGIILTAILTFVWQWNDSYYTFQYVSSIKDSFNTLTTRMMGVSQNIHEAIQSAGVLKLFGQDVSKNPLFTSMILNTSAILVMAPLIIIYMLVQKRLFTEGVERSGLVG